MQPEAQSTKKNGITTWVGIGVLVAVALGIFIFKNSDQKQVLPSAVPESTNTVTDAQSSAAPGSVKEFTVKGTNFAFDPATIIVKKGDAVKINFQDEKGTHNLIVEGYGVTTRTIGAGSTDKIEFTADKTGTFNYYCGIAGHRDFGMTGTLIVE